MTLRNNTPLTLQRQTLLLHSGRKFHSILQRANAGYPRSMEKILRMTYGRTGRRRYELLNCYADQTATEIQGTPPTSMTTVHPPPEPVSHKLSASWEMPPAIEALMKSQVSQQSQFIRSGTNYRVRLPFMPKPALNIRGDPICSSRRKNMLHAWYLSNVRAVMPPLPEQEYAALRRLVIGQDPMPAPPPRRPRARVPVAVHDHGYAQSDDKDLDEWLREEDEQVANLKTLAATQLLCLAQPLSHLHPQTPSSLVVEGPQCGPHPKDIYDGRPRRWDARNLRRLLQRAVLTQTPVVAKTAAAVATVHQEPAGAGTGAAAAAAAVDRRGDQSPNRSRPQKPKQPLAFLWDDGCSRHQLHRANINPPISPTQAHLLFG